MTLLEQIKCFVFQIELPEWIAIVSAVAALQRCLGCCPQQALLGSVPCPCCCCA